MLSASHAASAAEASPGGCTRLWNWMQPFCEGGVRAWDQGERDLHVFGHAHHGRGTYTRQRIGELNESMFGLALGKHHVDGRGRTHFLYAGGFQDSHFKPEWIAGYGWLAHWQPRAAGSLKLGAGFTAFVTTRSDYSRYLAPVPGVLPMAEIATSRFSIMATYVPRLSGNEGNGDVLILWARVPF